MPPPDQSFSSRAAPYAGGLAIPAYLTERYWWAYVHPRAVRLFEREWLVNLILMGNYARLRDAALAEIPWGGDGAVLQVACVYGNFTPRLRQRLGPKARLDVVDVLPIQLHNLGGKLPRDPRVALHHRDATDLGFADRSHDCAVLFFLLHEQPEEVRRRTLAEALRVLKPGGKLVLVDYHRPTRRHPLRFAFRALFRRLEPYALDLWREELTAFLPADGRFAGIEKETWFGGLYQKVVITR